MNNIGGIVKLELLPQFLVEQTVMTAEGVKITAEDEDAWVNLPITSKRTTATATPKTSGSGTTYEHQTSIFIAENKMDRFLLSLLTIYCPFGFIARVTDANGFVKIYGSREYPLKGTTERTSGNSASSLAGFQIELSCKCLYPETEYLGRC